MSEHSHRMQRYYSTENHLTVQGLFPETFLMKNRTFLESSFLITNKGQIFAIIGT